MISILIGCLTVVAMYQSKLNWICIYIFSLYVFEVRWLCAYICTHTNTHFSSSSCVCHISIYHWTFWICTHTQIPTSHLSLPLVTSPFLLAAICCPIQSVDPHPSISNTVNNPIFLFRVSKEKVVPIELVELVRYLPIHLSIFIFILIRAFKENCVLFAG